HQDPLGLDAVLDLVHRDDIDTVRHRLRLACETGAPYNVEHRIQRQDDGQLRWLKTYAEIEGAPGKAQRMSGFIQDITERKRIEAAIAESEAKYRSVVDHIREVVFQADGEGCWTFLNPAWEEITGFSVDESLGRRYIDFVHPRDRRGSEREFHQLMAGQRSSARSEVRYLTQRNDSRWLEVNVRVTVDEQGCINGCAGTLRDITEQRDAERKMRHLAHYDPIPGLPQRILALHRPTPFLQAPDRRHEQLAAL